MVTRRSLLKKAPVAAAAVAGGGLLLPRTASAHSEETVDILEPATGLESSTIDDFVLTDGTVNAKTWTQDGDKALIIRSGSSSGDVIARGIDAGDHIDVWFGDDHYDMYDLNMETRRRLVDETPDQTIAGMGLAGLAEIAPAAIGSAVSTLSLQYQHVVSLATGTPYIVADFFRGDLGWTRLVVATTAGAALSIAEIAANVATIQTELYLAIGKLVATEAGIAIAMCATMGTWAPIGAGFMVGAILLFGAIRVFLLNKQAIQLGRLYPLFAAGATATAAHTVDLWPESV